MNVDLNEVVKHLIFRDKLEGHKTRTINVVVKEDRDQIYFLDQFLKTVSNRCETNKAIVLRTSTRMSVQLNDHKFTMHTFVFPEDEKSQDSLLRGNSSDALIFDVKPDASKDWHKSALASANTALKTNPHDSVVFYND